MTSPFAGATRRRFMIVGAAALAMPALLRGASAPALAAPSAPAAPSSFGFKLGDFQITTLVDASVMIDGPWPIVGQDRPAPEVEALMVDNLLPPKRFRPGFTPVLVDTGSQRLLFDTGNGESGFVPPPAGGRLVAALAAAGYSPDDIDVVVITHAHPDHVGGLMTGGRPTFPKARYVIGAVEYDFWKKGEMLSAPRESNEYKSAVLFGAQVEPLRDRMSFLRPDGEVAPGIRAVDAPGHTPGHLAFHIESDGRRLLIWGDCAHHEVASLAQPDWHALFDMDKEKGAATRKRIYDMAATERLAVAGYHTSFPSVGFVERRGQGFRWLPLTYQFAE